ncbi:Transporter, drug/metabolite exporter family [Bifidobacterium actinocoloniiforme DSM 22766]|uniref:Transporter, drug/metabolite exporter family n=1 Tax=Bifidobacterium actinocoloniiforme DSM 22766 TaxID=1437605 RepID=A0A086Z2P5_9BIFI|nr:DMT family transporter [Bifidobacterium actinocoloniiforme]KFI40795.1 Transporter, drug/metabolite exporter family [Bifidobacterium actinocoloniiforme DSM 22766]
MTSRDDSIHLNPWAARLMLLAAAAAWGAGYTFEKIALRQMSVQWIMGVRLVIAVALMTLILWPKLRRAHLLDMLVPGLTLGITYWSAFLLQMEGLRTIGPGRNSFLTATYCVLVPFLVWAATRKRPAWRNFLAALLCVVGVGLISLSPNDSARLALSPGDLLTLAGAVCYGMNIVLAGSLAKNFDATILTYYELLVAGVLFLIGAALTEPAPQLATLHPQTIGALTYLVLVSTLIAQNLQNVAFSQVPAAQGSLILCTESLFGMAVSVLALGEELTTAHLVGFAIIFVGIVVSEVRIRRPGKAGDR